MSDQSNVSVDVFDLTGRKVRELSLGLALPGYYELTWDGTDRDGQALPGGLYLTRMHINGVRSVGFRRLIKK